MPEWRETLLDELLKLQHGDGAWGYRAGCGASPEATSLATIALVLHHRSSAGAQLGLNRLAGMQQSNGCVPAVPGVERAAWPTSLALLAWRLGDLTGIGSYTVFCKRAVDWLLSSRGSTFEPNPHVIAHDTQLVGWPWISETHSWVEPTAYAILALRSMGMAKHARVREGVRVLLDRAVAGGGWNYGNSRTFEADLRPFPETTGIALTALAGEPPDARIESAIAYALNPSQEYRSAAGLSWCLIGLSAWDRRPAGAESAVAAACAGVRDTDTAGIALLCMAGADRRLLHQWIAGEIA